MIGKTDYGRRSFLKVLGAGMASLAIPGVLRAGRKAQSKPNFVIIFTDDQGYQDVGCFGSPSIKTPNLDRMAAEGMKFTDFYAAASVCSPSRAALLTGCYPPRVGITEVLFPDDRIGLNPEEVTLAKILKEQGYATACIGKWHLGEPPEFHPHRHGFDYFFGLPFSNTHENPKYPDEPRLLHNDGTVEHRTDRGLLTRRCTVEAIRFLDQNKSHPFLLYFPQPMPHVLLDASPEFKGKSAGGLYGDTIEEVDWSVGEILRTLQQLGLDEKTLVVFTSDNGPWLWMKENGGCALPLRDGKFSTYEGGMREPCIMRWPAKIPTGTVCSELCGTIDLLPTFARLAGSRVPSDRVIDGKDIWPLMEGRSGTKSPHEAFFYYRGNNLEAVRSGKWKLRRVKKKTELYDLESDISEKKNLADKHPEIVTRLTGLMKEFDRELKANARPPGKSISSNKQ